MPAIIIPPPLHLARRVHEPARYFDGVSNQRFRHLAAPVTATPLTLAAWLTASVVNDVAIYVGVGDVSEHSFKLFTVSSGGTKLGAYATAAGTGAAAVAASVIPSGWFHGAAVFVSPTSRFCYQNGIAGAEVTTDLTPLGIDRMTIGISERYTSADWLGHIFWPAIWDVALTAGEIAALAKGRPPWEIRPGNLVACPCLRDGVDEFLHARWEILNSPGYHSAPFRCEARRIIVRAPAAPALPQGWMPEITQPSPLPIEVVAY